MDKSKDFVQAHKTDTFKGMLDENGESEKTPHHMLVDNDVYAEVFDTIRVEQTIARGIEALFWCDSDWAWHQDPISWETPLLLTETLEEYKDICNIRMNQQTKKVSHQDILFSVLRDYFVWSRYGGPS